MMLRVPRKGCWLILVFISGSVGGVVGTFLYLNLGLWGARARACGLFLHPNLGRWGAGPWKAGNVTLYGEPIVRARVRQRGCWLI